MTKEINFEKSSCNQEQPLDKVLANIKNAIENQNSIRDSLLGQKNDIIELTNIVSNEKKDESIISKKTSSAVSQHLQNLAEQILKINKNNRILSDKEIKEVFKEVLKPYLKSWLDNNLTKIVKEIVDKEIKLLLTKNR